MFSFSQRGFDEQGRRLRKIEHGLENPDPLLAALGIELAEMWRANILAGPNPRWQAGLSRRAMRQGGTTLYDTGLMMRSIVGPLTGPRQVTVGSALTVGRGFNLLALHEFGVDAQVSVAGFTRLQKSRNIGSLRKRKFTGSWQKLKAGPVATGVAFVRPFMRHQRLPRRPTSPFDWDRQELTPEADTLVRSRTGNYLVELTQ